MASMARTKDTAMDRKLQGTKCKSTHPFWQKYSLTWAEVAIDYDFTERDVALIIGSLVPPQVNVSPKDRSITCYCDIHLTGISRIATQCISSCTSTAFGQTYGYCNIFHPSCEMLKKDTFYAALLQISRNRCASIIIYPNTYTGSLSKAVSYSLVSCSFI